MTNALEVINRVRPVAFRYAEDYRNEHPAIRDVEYYNVVAQEFAEVFPHAVQKGGDKLPSGEEILQVDTYPATIYSIAAIQELHSRLREKEAEIEAMKERLAAVEKLLSSLSIKTGVAQ